MGPAAAVILVSMLLAAPSRGDSEGLLRLCLEDQSGLPAIAELEIRAELRALLPRVAFELESGPCPPPAADSVRIRLSARPDGMSESALGAARTEGNRIVPDLLVFPAAVQELTGARGWERLGRAIARVAAHEVAHYLEQSPGHERSGLLRAAFPPSELASPEARADFTLRRVSRRH